MAGWKGGQDTVENQVYIFNTFNTFIVTNISGRFLQLRASTRLCMGTRRTQWRTPPPPTSLTYRQVASLPATTRFRRIIWFGFDHLCILTCRGWDLEATSSPMRGHPLPGLVSPMSPGCMCINRWYISPYSSIRSKSDKCSDCPNRNCLNCPLKKRGSSSKCSDCSVERKGSSDMKEKEGGKGAWWAFWKRN